MRLIDVDDAVKRLHKAEQAMEVVSVVGFKVIDISAVPQFLEMLPTIDAVPVVRCKDCAYMLEAKVNKKGFLICPASGMEITDDDFCSYGERREEEE
jgi:hypothetical protein